MSNVIYLVNEQMAQLCKLLEFVNQADDLKAVIQQHTEAINQLRKELSIVQEWVELLVAHASEDDDAPSIN